jgi:glycosyltransferase involved in cell wall biosynthesis
MQVDRRLTVAIPTYNRAPILRTTVNRVLRHTDAEVSVQIVDNHSSDDTRQVIEEIVSLNPSRSIRYARNPCNIGGDANILRCLELSTTGWVWILGDDDSPAEDFQRIILEKIASYPEACAINFETSISRVREGSRSGDTVARSASELIGKLPDFSNFLFLSATVFNREKALPFLRHGFEAITTHAPHLAIILKASEGNPEFLYAFCPGFICEWEPNTRGDGWDDRKVGPRLQLFALQARDVRDQAILSNKIAIHFSYETRDLYNVSAASRESLIAGLQQTAPSAFIRACATNRLKSFAAVLLVRVIRQEHPIIGRVLSGMMRMLRVR